MYLILQFALGSSPAFPSTPRKFISTHWQLTDCGRFLASSSCFLSGWFLPEVGSSFGDGHYCMYMIRGDPRFTSRDYSKRPGPGYRTYVKSQWSELFAIGNLKTTSSSSSSPILKQGTKPPLHVFHRKPTFKNKTVSKTLTNPSLFDI